MTADKKIGRIDSRVQSGDILELREKGQKTEFHIVTDVVLSLSGERLVTISNLKCKKNSEAWDIDDLKDWAFYSSRSAESLAPKSTRRIDMTEQEYLAVKQFLATLRKEAK